MNSSPEGSAALRALLSDPLLTVIMSSVMLVPLYVAPLMETVAPAVPLAVPDWFVGLFAARAVIGNAIANAAAAMNAISFFFMMSPPLLVF